MTTRQIKIVSKLIPIFTGKAAVRAAWGGRGSGKTRSFALMAALKGYQFGMEGISGVILCARQFQNSLAESSLEEIKRAIEAHDFLRDYYKIGEASIKSNDKRGIGSGAEYDWSNYKADRIIVKRAIIRLKIENAVNKKSDADVRVEFSRWVRNK